METFYKQQIKDAYSRCFGLENMVKRLNFNDDLMFTHVVATLANQTGLRTDFIEDNLNEIKELTT